MTTAFDVVLKDIDERRNSVALAIVRGAAKDYAEYKQLSGEIQGLDFAYSAIMEMVRRLESDEDK